MKACTSIVSPTLPNGLVLKVCDYADETVLFMATESSVIEVQNMVWSFKLATGAMVNREKLYYGVRVLGFSFGVGGVLIPCGSVG